MEDGRQTKHLVFEVMRLANELDITEVKDKLYNNYPDLNKMTIDGVIEEAFYMLHRFR